MLEYDPAFDPPAPIVTVKVRDPATGAVAECQAQIDTGSFMSALPESMAQDLGLEPHGRVMARGVDAQVIELSTYIVTLIIEGHVIIDTEVGALEREDILLGRDVLRHFILTLNGKTETFELIDP